jgi:hypothetical protein
MPEDLHLCEIPSLGRWTRSSASRPMLNRTPASSVIRLGLRDLNSCLFCFHQAGRWTAFSNSSSAQCLEGVTYTWHCAKYFACMSPLILTQPREGKTIFSCFYTKGRRRWKYGGDLLRVALLGSSRSRIQIQGCLTFTTWFQLQNNPVQLWGGGRLGR